MKAAKDTKMKSLKTAILVLAAALTATAASAHEPDDSLAVEDRKHLDRVLAALRKVKLVQDVSRIK